MTLVQAAIARLAGDSRIVALTPGGIYPVAPSKAATPNAFDRDGYLIPCLTVVARNAGVVGPGMALRSLQVWLYATGPDRAHLDNLKPLIHGLLHGRQLPTDTEGEAILEWSGDLGDNPGDPDLRLVALDRMDFTAAVGYVAA